MKHLTSPLNIPKFAPGVRLHWSSVRQQHWLLFPEGALLLNQTAVSILKFCDGQHSPAEIIAGLENHFQTVDSLEIQQFLSRLINRGLLVICTHDTCNSNP